MPTIQISNLHPTGYELFQGTESFLDELGTDEVEGVRGGCYGLNHQELLLLLEKFSIATPDRHHYQGEQTLVGIYGNGINNNTVNGQTYNAYTAANVNTAP